MPNEQRVYAKILKKYNVQKICSIQEKPANTLFISNHAYIVINQIL